jgi:hypothetical protein
MPMASTPLVAFDKDELRAVFLIHDRKAKGSGLRGSFDARWFNAKHCEKGGRPKHSSEIH